MTTEDPEPNERRIRLTAGHPETASAQHFSILVICTAHHCRSPVMDAVWTAQAQRRFGSRWRISSAGTAPRVGTSTHPLAVTALAAAGFGSTVDRARQLDAHLVRAADLILTAERRHRADVVRLVPAAVNRSFTLREFARLAGTIDPIVDDDPVSAGHELVRRSRQARADHPPVGAGVDDLIDPMGGDSADFTTCVLTVCDAVERILSPWDAGRPAP